MEDVRSNKCEFCREPIGYWRSLLGKRFCSQDHAAAFNRKLTEKMLTRLGVSEAQSRIIALASEESARPAENARISTVAPIRETPASQG